ncbi:Stealth protein CR4, conserved region 4 [Arthrobacter crystallopoietes]|uniref:Stealth protein CR4, conserved region 4 n=2 Tax=Crystallibacter crystallopoietes TaxID=37928 RepID=A0A1H1G8L3_9MICC|nr:Stealth protein CR4, conserved region 4 [Arthrobacter crystallopoietes]
MGSIVLWKELMIAGLRGAIARNLPQPVVQTVFDVFHGRTQLQTSLRSSIARFLARAALAGMTGHVSAVVSDGSVFLTRTVERFSAVEAVRANLDLAQLSADVAGIDYRVEQPNPNKPASLVIDDGQWAELLRALKDVSVGRAVYAKVGDSAPMLLSDFDQLDVAQVTVFEPQSTDGLLLAGSELGCEIIAKPGRTACVAVTELLEPIDVVYTWVDGGDPEWQARKAEALSRMQPGGLNEFSANDERYRSHDELRYSLRSLDYFAPWINHVYLVTAEQIPEWLATSNPRITVVDHQEIFPDGALPTFNSHAIEARLHHIPGLSEHFLYLNDDVFFGRQVQPELFFEGSGLSRFFLSEQQVDEDPPNSADLPVDSAAKQNRALIEQRFGRTVRFKFKHAAHSERVSTLRQVEQDFPAKHAETSRSQFRSPSDISIPSSLAHYYGYMIGAAVPGNLKYRYCDIGDGSAQAKLLRLLRDRDADVFCLNEIGGSPIDRASQDQLVQQFLRAYFPVPSSFELGE